MDGCENNPITHPLPRVLVIEHARVTVENVHNNVEHIALTENGEVHLLHVIDRVGHDKTTTRTRVKHGDTLAIPKPMMATIKWSPTDLEIAIGLVDLGEDGSPTLVVFGIEKGKLYPTRTTHTANSTGRTPYKNGVIAGVGRAVSHAPRLCCAALSG